MSSARKLVNAVNAIGEFLCALKGLQGPDNCRKEPDAFVGKRRMEHEGREQIDRQGAKHRSVLMRILRHDQTADEVQVVDVEIDSATDRHEREKDTEKTGIFSACSIGQKIK